MATITASTLGAALEIYNNRYQDALANNSRRESERYASNWNQINSYYDIMNAALGEADSDRAEDAYNGIVAILNTEGIIIESVTLFQTSVAFSIIPSNIEIPTDIEGNNPSFVNSNSDIIIYEYNIDVTDTWGFSIITETNVSATLTDNTVSITDITEDEGLVVVRCSKFGFDSVDLDIPVRRIRQNFTPGGEPGTTDDLPEGIINFYFTEARANAASDVVANTAVRHTHTNKTTLDAITDEGSGEIITAGERSDISDNTADRHTHANKTTLDAITDEGSGAIITTGERSDISDNNTHRASTANPHATDIGNIGSGTLAELNTKVTDATLIGDWSESYILYVGKHGNDSNDGTNISKAFLTIGAAITEAISLTPASDNRIAVYIADAGEYTENLAMPSWVGVIGHSSKIIGNHTIEDNSLVESFRLVSTTGTCITKSTGTGIATVKCERIVLSGSGGGVVCSNGTISYCGNSVELENGVAFASTSTAVVDINVSSITITGTGYGALLVADGILYFQAGCITGASGTGLYTAGSGVINASVVHIDCSTAYNVGVGAVLNLISSSLSGTQTNAGTVRYMVSDVGIDVPIAQIGTLFLDDNTDGHIIVADGTNFNSVAMSGDATISNTGVVTVTSSTSPPIIRYQADQFLNVDPTGTDYAENVMAPVILDPNNSALLIRAFDDTTEEGVGFVETVPTGFTNIVFNFKTRGADTGNVVPLIYIRSIPDNSAIGSWDTGTSLTPLALVNTEYYQYDSQAISLASLSITGGNMYQFELTRDTSDGGDTLSGDWMLLELIITYS